MTVEDVDEVVLAIGAVVASAVVAASVTEVVVAEEASVVRAAALATEVVVEAAEEALEIEVVAVAEEASVATVVVVSVDEDAELVDQWAVVVVDVLPHTRRILPFCEYFELCIRSYLSLILLCYQFSEKGGRGLCPSALSVSDLSYDVCVL